ncbi:MAG: PorV/PorQ family protein [Candidatus Zixiibacteriota bacterium]|nr:MAG: PorV/PorQ family protein [candidate division Zixibacteria bacterium]
MRIYKKHIGLLLGIILLLLPSLAFSQAKVGTTGVNFLELGVSARAMGMAEAFTAGVDDASAVFYNPAALTYIYGLEMMFTHIRLPADINYEFLSMVLPVDAVGGVIGVGIYSLNTGDILYTDYSYPYSYEDEWGNKQFFSAGDVAVSLSYGRYLTDKFSLGFTVKYIREDLSNVNATGWAADVGTCYDSGYRDFKIAMLISNFGPDMKHLQKEFPLPINFKFGGSINFIDAEDHVVMLAAEGGHPADNLEKYNVGMEYRYLEKFSLRIGERFNYDSDGLTAGGGLRLPIAEEVDLSVDYAYQDFGWLNEIHRFSIGLSF